MQKVWTERKIADMLLMDVKGKFHHVSQNFLLRAMEDMRADGDLIDERSLSRQT